MPNQFHPTRFLLCIAILCAALTSHGQALEWTTAVKVDDNFHQTPIGEIDGHHYILFGNVPYQTGNYVTADNTTGIAIGKKKLKLVKFSPKRDSFKEVYFDFRRDISDLITAYVYNNEVHIIYLGPDETIVKKVFDKDLAEKRSFESSIKGRKQERGRFSNIKGEYKYAVSEDKKQFAISIYQTVEVLDPEFKSLGTVKVPEVTDVEKLVINNGKTYFIGLEGEYRKYTGAGVYSFDAATKELKKEKIDNTTATWNPNIFFDPAGGKLHYFSFSGDAERCLDRKGELVRYEANKLHHWVFSAQLGKEASESVSLEKFTFNNGKRTGIEYPSIEYAFFNDGVDVVIAPHYSEMTSGKFFEYHDNIYFLKIKNGSLASDRQIEKWARGHDNWYYLYPTVAFSMKDKYVVLYHQGVSSYELHKVVLDRNFQVISDDVIKSYKDNKYYLALDEPLRLNDGTHLIWGRYNANTGTALLRVE